jgi:hypothetical protein
MANLPAEWPSWDIHVDIVGFALTAKTTRLTFVECKNAAITLDHLSQILGYSRVALPEFSFLIAPQGVSDSLRTLLLTHHRLDILNYDQRPGLWPRSIIVARWNEAASTLDADSIITGDMNRLGTL